MTALLMVLENIANKTAHNNSLQRFIHLSQGLHGSEEVMWLGSVWPLQLLSLMYL